MLSSSRARAVAARRCVQQQRSLSAWPLCTPNTVAVVGAPQEYGQPMAGVNRGPALLREAGLRHVLRDLRWRVEDMGDVDMKTPGASPKGEERARHAALISAGSQRLRDACFEAANNGRMVLTIGGDHSIALGTVAGVLKARPDTRVLWVDAHADINTPSQSASGNMHGMPLAFLLGLTDPQKDDPAGDFAWLKEQPLLRPDRLAYIGLRDVDRSEKNTLNELKARGVFVSSMHDVDKSGIGTVVNAALLSLGYDTDDPTKNCDAPLHLSFDIDACDPIYAPATGTVVRGGLSYREAHYVCEAVALTERLASMDIVEVNNALSDASGAEATVLLAKQLVGSALGDSIL